MKITVRLIPVLVVIASLFGCLESRAWYDPARGRWLSRDPVGESGGINLYTYCGNNPLNYIDPYGEASLIPGGNFGGGVGHSMNVEQGVKFNSKSNTITAGPASVPFNKSYGVYDLALDTIAFGSLFAGGGGGAAAAPVRCAAAAKSSVTVLEEAGGAIHLSVKTSKGTVEVISNIAREGDTLALRSLHMGGSEAGALGRAGINELKQAAAQFGAERGASQVLIQGRTRTSGRLIGTTPSPIMIPVK